jgi:hypothetical protein
MDPAEEHLVPAGQASVSHDDIEVAIPRVRVGFQEIADGITSLRTPGLATTAGTGLADGAFLLIVLR